MAERSLIIRLIGDSRDLERTFTRGAQASKKFSGTIKEQASAGIVGAAQQRQNLEKLSAEYRLVARNAKKGSEAQVVAARLAAKAERELASSAGIAARSLERTSARSSHTLVALTKSTGGFSRGFLSGAGALSSFGGALALTSGSFFAGAGIVAGMGAAVTEAAHLERTLNVLQQVTGATADQMSAAGSEARKLGGDISLPATSATDAAQAMEQLAKGGLSIEEALSAARGTLQLAAAAQTDVGTAANTTARALSAFGLAGSDAGKIADALAGGAQAATGEIQDFAIALSQSGTVAHSFGLTAQDTVAAITELAKAGIVGSDAGTSLRVMLSRLIPSSKQAREEMKKLGVHVADASGKFLPFRDIIDQYAKELEPLPAATRQQALQTIFGTDAQRAANIIFGQGVSVYDTFTKAVTKQGSAAEAAAARNKGLLGAADGLKSSLQTLAATLGGKVNPTLTTATRGLSLFFSELNAGDFSKIGDQITSGLGNVAGSIRDSLANVDWVSTLKTVGQDIGRGLIASLDGVRAALQSVNWNTVGAEIVRGLEGAVAAVAIVLRNINWGGVAVSIVKLMNAAIKAQAQVVFGIGREIATQLFAGLQAGFTKAAAGLQRLSISLVLKIIEPFTHLPRFLGGGPFRKMKEGLQQTLDDMRSQGLSGGQAVGAAVVAGITQGLQNFTPVDNAGETLATKVATIAGRTAAAAAQAAAGATSATTADTGTTRRPVKITADQRNTFFDNSISRILLRGGLGDIKAQIAALQKANALIGERLKVTKDVTRRLTLEDELLQNAAQIKSLNAQQAADALSKRQDAMQEFIANLQLGVTKAQATASFTDDIAALQALQAGIRKQIKETGLTADLAGQLFDVQQNIKNTRKQERSASLFKQLGLTAEGDEITPGVKNLRKRLKQLSENIAGTKLDTPKLETQLARFRKVLSKKLLPQDIRAKVKQMMDDIADQLKKSGPRVDSKFRRVNVEAIMRGLGLSPEQMRVLRSRLSQIGANGTVPGSRSAAFSGAVAQFTVTTNVNLDGRTVAQNTTSHQQKAAKRRTTTRRGSYAGKH